MPVKADLYAWIARKTGLPEKVNELAYVPYNHRYKALDPSRAAIKDRFRLELERRAITKRITAKVVLRSFVALLLVVAIGGGFVMGKQGVDAATGMYREWREEQRLEEARKEAAAKAQAEAEEAAKREAEEQQRAEEQARKDELEAKAQRVEEQQQAAAAAEAKAQAEARKAAEVKPQKPKQPARPPKSVTTTRKPTKATATASKPKPKPRKTASKPVRAKNPYANWSQQQIRAELGPLQFKKLNPFADDLTPKEQALYKALEAEKKRRMEAKIWKK